MAQPEQTINIKLHKLQTNHLRYFIFDKKFIFQDFIGKTLALAQLSKSAIID